MPIQILKYVTHKNEVWTHEHSGSRFVAKCASKRGAARIAKLLNAELNQQPAQR